MSTDDFAPDSMAAVVRAQTKARSRANARGLKADDAVMSAISDQVLERLPLLLIEPKQLLDLGCRNGEQFERLSNLYPDCTVTGFALGESGRPKKAAPQKGFLSRIPSVVNVFGKQAAHSVVSGDPHFLPFDDQQFDLVVSNLCLPFCQRPSDVFAEVSRILRPGGAFLFSSLGPDTLIEYRQLWALVDAYPHVSGLIDMHDLGDAMLHAGLADAVLDRNTLNLDYPSVAALENELQVFGLVNTAFGRRRGLMSLSNATKIRAHSTRFTVGLELVHGHAWKGELHPQRNSYNDEFLFPVSELQGSWKR